MDMIVEIQVTNLLTFSRTSHGASLALNIF